MSAKRQDVDAKLVFLAQSLRAKLLTTDYNLAKMAEFHGVQWLNLNDLSQALHQELMVGDRIEIDLVKLGKEEGQAVGFMEDGSMVVVGAGARPSRAPDLRRDHERPALGRREDDIRTIRGNPRPDDLVHFAGPFPPWTRRAGRRTAIGNQAPRKPACFAAKIMRAALLEGGPA